jgi:thiol-disulfide isomerase/thioredoxin
MKTKIFILTFFMILTGMISAQTTPEAASVILDKAYKQAAAEKKNVMVVFHASWCGWCRKFEASVNDSSCKAYFEKSYVICYLTILERNEKKALDNPGAEDIFNKYAGKNSGIPFFLIYDKKGKLLADSMMKPAGGDANAKPVNLGCPASDEEVAAFIEILKKTSKINDKEIAAASARFKKNKS